MGAILFIVHRLIQGSRNSFSSFIIRIAVVAVALSVATMIITTSLVNGFQHEIRNKIFSFWSHINIQPFTLSRSLDERGIALQQSFYVNAASLPCARHIQACAIKGGLLKNGNLFEGVALKGIGSDFDTARFRPFIKSGNFVAIDRSVSRSDLLVSTTIARHLRIGVNDKVNVSFPGQTIRTRPFRVCGLYETGLEEIDEHYVICDISVIQQLNNWGRDTVGYFEVFLHDEAIAFTKPEGLIGSLYSLYGNDGSLTKSAGFDDCADRIADAVENPMLDVQTIRSLFPGIFDWLELQNMNEAIILSLMLLVAIINMITAILILIIERTRMVGIMKVMGARNSTVRKVFIGFGIYICGLGMILGNLFGLGLCVLQQQCGFIRLPKESYFLEVAPVQIDPFFVVGINFITLTTCAVFLILPSMFINGVRPVNAIRFQ